MPRRYEHEVQKSIDQELAALRARLEERPARKTSKLAEPSIPSAAPQQTEENHDSLNLSHGELDSMLNNLTSQLKRDFEQLLDKVDRKNLIANIVLSTIFLILGWGLSIIAAPELVSRLFSR